MHKFCCCKRNSVGHGFLVPADDGKPESDPEPRCPAGYGPYEETLRKRFEEALPHIKAATGPGSLRLRSVG